MQVAIDRMGLRPCAQCALANGSSIGLPVVFHVSVKGINMLSLLRVGNGGGLRCLIAMVFMFVPAWTALAATKVHSGHSAMWYMPERNGEGWTLEILPDDHAVVYWFTYDNAGNPRWLIGYGDIARADDGDEIQFAHLYAVHGPHFGPDFDPADAVREDKGWAKIRFTDCQSGEIVYDAYGQSGTYPLTRLTRTMGANCDPIHGVPGEPVQSYAGTTGSWYDPASDGQGFSLQWLSNDIAGLMWFTFDPQGNPYWLTGTGEAVGDKIVFANLYAARGGRFDAAFDPNAVVLSHWGSLELTLQCDRGTGVYQPTMAGFAAGSFALQRVTSLQHLPCPWVKPKLDDLYELEWVELPIPRNVSPMDDQFFEMTSIADDGTVVGVGKVNGESGVVRLLPGSTEWELMLKDGIGPRITPDGSAIFAEVFSSGDPECAPSCRRIRVWRPDVGWQPLRVDAFQSYVVYGISKNGDWIFGKGNDGEREGVNAWKWSAETGEIQLQSPLIGIPYGISDDGNVLVGGGRRFTGGGTQYPGLQWTGSESVLALTDARDGQELGWASACNRDCSLIFGAGWSVIDPMQSFSYSPWLMRASGEVTYLDVPEIEGFGGIAVVDSSAEGGIVAGTYGYFNADAGWFVPEGWLWTQDTGMVLLQPIIDEYQFSDTWERNLRDISTNGRLLLFSGWEPSLDPRVMTQYRAAILRLKLRR